MRIKTAIASVVLAATAFMGVACEVPEEGQNSSSAPTKVEKTQTPKKTPKAPKKGLCDSVSATAKPHCEKLVQHPWYVTVDDQGQNPHTHPAGKDILNYLEITKNGKELDWAIQAAVVDFQAAYLDQTGEEFTYKK